MNEVLPPDPELDRLANAAAEEILQVIYGEDLVGCAVRPESIAAVIRGALAAQEESRHALMELYRKAFEATHLMATPPADGHALTPDELRSLLGDRLDGIRTLAAKITSVTDPRRQQADAEES
jgi:hypothetical protein